MRLSIWFDDDNTTPDLESFIHGKIRSALHAHAHRVSRCQMRIRHQNTADGPIVRCSIDLKSTALGMIHVDESDVNEFAAIASALRVASLKLKRAAERRKDNGRRRGRSGKCLVRDEVTSSLYAMS